MSAVSPNRPLHFREPLSAHGPHTCTGCRCFSVLRASAESTTWALRRAQAHMGRSGPTCTSRCRRALTTSQTSARTTRRQVCGWQAGCLLPVLWHLRACRAVLEWQLMPKSFPRPCSPLSCRLLLIRRLLQVHARQRGLQVRLGAGEGEKGCRQWAGGTGTGRALRCRSDVATKSGRELERVSRAADNRGHRYREGVELPLRCCPQVNRTWRG